MTSEQIDNMEAGPELDALVAEKVMGYRLVVDECEYPVLNDGRVEFKPGCFKTFMPSRDIAAAWEVVEKFKFHPDNDVDWHWSPEIGWMEERAQWYAVLRGHEGLGTTAPLAICRAALKIKGC